MQVTLKDIEKFQQEWSEAVLNIKKAQLEGENIQSLAIDFINDYYDFDHDQFLYNPAFAVDQPFRNDKNAALSYFIGGNPNFIEDEGFALKEWKDIIFKNHDYIFRNELTIVSGDCILNSIDGRIYKSEFTMGFSLSNGKVKILFEDSHLISQSRVFEYN